MEQVLKKYGKETLDYSVNKHDFVGSDELTVTITLAEYRELVKISASKDAEISRLHDKISQAKANAEKMEMSLSAKNAEIAALRDQIDSARSTKVMIHD